MSEQMLSDRHGISTRAAKAIIKKYGPEIGRVLSMDNAWVADTRAPSEHSMLRTGSWTIPRYHLLLAALAGNEKLVVLHARDTQTRLAELSKDPDSAFFRQLGKTEHPNYEHIAKRPRDFIAAVQQLRKKSASSKNGE